METVSILIPCYNNEEHVGAAIESALNQTWPDCEIIIVDDGSDDDSLSVARRYESEEVRVLTQENQGAGAARNRALRASSGEYIQFLDADDLLHPRKIEAQISALREKPAGTVAVCSTVYFQDGKPPENGRRAEGEHIPWLSSNDPVQCLINLWMPGRGWGMVGVHAWLTPCDVIEDAGLWAEYTNPDDDGEFFTRALLQSEGMKYVKEGCVYYRQHSGERVSGLVSEDALRGLLRSTDTRRDHVLPRTTEENREEAKYVIARRYWNVAVRSLPISSDISKEASDRARELGMSKPPESVLSKTTKSRFTRTLFGWRGSRYLQHWYRRLTSNAA